MALRNNAPALTRRVFLAGSSFGIGRAAQTQPRIAITMDDVHWMQLADPLQANAHFLDVMSANRIRLALFVIGRNADSETGRQLVRAWSAAGHLIGNHTYSHRSYTQLTFDEFSADTTRADSVLHPYMTADRRFRFPALKEGDTAEKRDRMREFLTQKGYRNGHVTVDASDWYYDRRLSASLAADPGFDTARFRQPYLDHLWDRAQFYDRLSQQMLGRSIPHTLLIHYNRLNSLFLLDVLEMFRKRGWQLIDAAEAYRDPVFQRAPKIVPAGESLLWALAKESGKFEAVLRYPGESDEYEKPKLDRLFSTPK